MVRNSPCIKHGTYAAALAAVQLSSLYAIGHQPAMLHRIINRFRNVARKEDPAIVLENIPSDFRDYIDASRRDAALVACAASLDTDETVVMSSAFNSLKR